GMFRYLKVGLCFVLSFVGVKMLISDFYKIPITVSLGVVAGILAASIVLSLLLPAKEEVASGDAGEAPAQPQLAEEFAPQESDLAIATGKCQRGHQETREEEKEHELV
ncbi:MAG: hypothetical protein IH610_14160, partial [Deltaproteobacteria bacterium]|nr:hypothetical protein [Deltaproteobacteria bacterium]